MMRCHLRTEVNCSSAVGRYDMTWLTIIQFFFYWSVLSHQWLTPRMACTALHCTVLQHVHVFAHDLTLLPHHWHFKTAYSLSLFTSLCMQSITPAPSLLHSPLPPTIWFNDSTQSPSILLILLFPSFPPCLPSILDLAKMLQSVGVDNVLSVDLQRPGQGHEACFFDCAIPVETVSTNSAFAEYFKNNIHPPLKKVIDAV